MLEYRQNVQRVIEDSRFQNFILAIIGINAVTLGLETSQTITSKIGGLLNLLDTIFLTIFLVEILLKLSVQHFRFFRNGWNVFDFLVVGIALLPVSEGLTVLRALRILRVLRILHIAPRLRRVVEGFLSALPGMASVFLLMTLIFYIASVMATQLFGAAFPDWFGSLGLSAYSLFQIMTLESWSMGIVRPVMAVYPMAWLFFVPFIMVTTFAVVNLLVGLIVNSMQDAHAEESNAATDLYRAEIQARLTRIEKLLEDKATR